MTNTWPCGTPRSSNNALSGALLEDRPAAVLRVTKTPAKRSPTIALPGSFALDIRGQAVVSLAPRKGSISIGRSDIAKTTRILRGGI